MPKFYCSHCGQHIDSPDSLANTQANCPTCQGDITVPPLDNSSSLDSTLDNDGSPQITTEIYEPSPPIRRSRRNRRTAKSKQSSGSVWSNYKYAALITGAWSVLMVIITPETELEKMGFIKRNFMHYCFEVLGGFAFLMGASILLGLITAGIIVAINKNSFKKTLSKVTLVMAIVLTCITILGQINSRQLRGRVASKKTEREQAREIFSTLQNDFQSIVDQQFDENGAPQQVGTQLKEIENPQNDLESIQSVLNGLVNDIVGLQNNYLRKLDQHGIDKLLDPSHIKNDVGYKKSTVIMQNILKEINNIRDQGIVIMKSFPERLEKQGNLSQKEQNTFVRRYQRGLEGSLSQYNQIWQLEEEALHHINATVKHLDRTRNYWSVSDGIFMFERDRDLETFNQYMRDIQNIVAKQDSIRKDMQQQATDKLNWANNRQ